RTNGPEVYENMECSIPGIFACGNVVQVHDLVDFVSEEAQLAGRSAAEFLQKGSQPAGRLITLTGGSDVSYTLPQKIRFDAMPDRIKLSFRVRRSFGESKIILRAGDAILASFKRSHMAPGEMERVTLPKKLLNEVSGNEIILEVKEA
ncbi:MAG: pyridine nucleotide-disulfide oxidoreductase, partial [Clostridia bacterium]|nr:pyridine nucleotide-disulfide oxidoreductase [Clostridia bacterium]